MAYAEGTPGGNRLRLLRERLNKTQLVVELDAELGSGYLQRLEAGKVVHPERKTLERVLTALTASYTEQRDILELFGYNTDMPLPDASEIKWALSLCQKELHDVTFPAYVLDSAARLLAYNRYFPKLLGLTPDSPRITRMLGVSLLKIWFDPTSELYRLLQDPPSFLPGVIQALKYEMRLFYAEKWYAEILKELLETLPLFRKYWELSLSQNKSNYAVAGRPLELFGLNVPNCGLLQFRLSSERFIQDERFRIIYYLPGDAPTIQQFSKWATEV